MVILKPNGSLRIPGAPTGVWEGTPTSPETHRMTVALAAKFSPEATRLIQKIVLFKTAKSVSKISRVPNASQGISLPSKMDLINVLSATTKTVPSAKTMWGTAKLAFSGLLFISQNRHAKDQSSPTANIL